MQIKTVKKPASVLAGKTLHIAGVTYGETTLKSFFRKWQEWALSRWSTFLQ
jgi:hypothetical protein